MGIILRKFGGWEAGLLNFLLLLQGNLMKRFLQETNIQNCTSGQQCVKRIRVRNFRSLPSRMTTEIFHVHVGQTLNVMPGMYCIDVYTSFW